ncbi:MAG: hypothetical protein IJ970_00915, partial [Mycoplasmataceae bacterium]|nr:hypothetical protein [Mycoplasmataceae bacterium]
MKSINDIVKKVDIVNIVSSFTTLNKSGTSFKTMCNVHLDSSPSLFVNPKKQIYKCFVCDHGGDALDYLMWSQKFDWNQAIEFLIKASGANTRSSAAWRRPWTCSCAAWAWRKRRSTWATRTSSSSPS